MCQGSNPPITTPHTRHLDVLATISVLGITNFKENLTAIQDQRTDTDAYLEIGLDRKLRALFHRCSRTIFSHSKLILSATCPLKAENVESRVLQFIWTLTRTCPRSDEQMIDEKY